MIKAIWLFPVAFGLAACGTKEANSDQGGLQSDMPLRTVKYYMENSDELAKTEEVCTAWRASQRPPASWPAVVVSNCNNSNTARTLLRNKSDTDKLRKEAGV